MNFKTEFGSAVTKLNLPTRPIMAIRALGGRLRGGSQSYRVLAQNGLNYAVKFWGNPQGSRTIINEIIAYELALQLKLNVARLDLLVLPSSLKDDPSLTFTNGCRPQGSIHLGSRYPVNPDRFVIFDFLPERLLTKVANLEEFATMWVFDRWLYQCDIRQAVFVRDRSVDNRTSLRAYFIDFGMSFGGCRWEFGDVPEYGLAYQTRIYSLVAMQDLFKPALERISSLSESDILGTRHAVPVNWTLGDNTSLDILLEGLCRRRQKLPELVERHYRFLVQVGPNALLKRRSVA